MGRGPRHYPKHNMAKRNVRWERTLPCKVSRAFKYRTHGYDDKWLRQRKGSSSDLAPASSYVSQRSSEDQLRFAIRPSPGQDDLDGYYQHSEVPETVRSG